MRKWRNSFLDGRRTLRRGLGDGGIDIRGVYRMEMSGGVWIWRIGSTTIAPELEDGTR